jgi:hypothetical protein
MRHLLRTRTRLLVDELRPALFAGITFTDFPRHFTLLFLILHE